MTIVHFSPIFPSLGLFVIETLHKEIQIRWHLVNFESLNWIKLLVQFYKLSVAEKPIFTSSQVFVIPQRSNPVTEEELLM